MTATAHNIRLAPEAHLAAKYANRHGLITGSTGSGKTQTMLRLVSEFHAAGVPTFVADVKGDIIQATEAAMAAGVPVQALNPGDNFRLGLQSMGADLAARALSLTDAQQGLLEIALKRGANEPRDIVPLLMPGDGGKASVRALSRALDRVPSDVFGGVPFDVAALLSADSPFTVLDARDMVESGSVYAAAVIFMLDELYSRLDEVGDRIKPVLAFFVDEAHLLFNDCPPRLLARIERIVRLIRSKGVSLWFVSQSPRDVPDLILGQLGNRVQHSLRAATPRDWKAVQVAVETLPAARGVDMVKTVGTMGPGQALVSLIGWSGLPLMTELVQVDAPAWRPGEANPPLIQRGEVEPVRAAPAAVRGGRSASALVFVALRYLLGVLARLTIVMASALTFFLLVVLGSMPRGHHKGGHGRHLHVGHLRLRRH